MKKNTAIIFLCALLIGQAQADEQKASTHIERK